jgi:acyl carrier protein
VSAAVNDVLDSLARLARPPLAADAVDPSASLTADLGIDSLAFMELLIDLENRLGIVFDDDRLSIEAFGKVGDLLEYINLKASLRG